MVEARDPARPRGKRFGSLVHAVLAEAPLAAGSAEIARLAAEVNQKTEDIGARRLHTIMERVLEEISFSAAEHGGETFLIDRQYVLDRVADLVEDEDLSNYIL